MELANVKIDINHRDLTKFKLSDEWTYHLRIGRQWEFREEKIISGLEKFCEVSFILKKAAFSHVHKFESRGCLLFCKYMVKTNQTITRKLIAISTRVLTLQIDKWRFVILI